MKNYKNHTQTAEAQYYLADCDFQRNKFNEAIVAYQTVIEKIPQKSSSAPKAYLKQAICFGKIGNKAAARNQDAGPLSRNIPSLRKWPEPRIISRPTNDGAVGRGRTRHVAFTGGLARICAAA